jgi:hypothetical protein
MSTEKPKVISDRDMSDIIWATVTQGAIDAKPPNLAGYQALAKHQVQQLTLTPEEKAEAKTWVLQQLGDLKTFEAQILTVLITGAPLHELPSYHQHVAEDRRRVEESRANQKIQADWKTFVEAGFKFEAQDWTVELVVADPAVELSAIGLGQIKGTLHEGRELILDDPGRPPERQATSKFEFMGLQAWIDAVKAESARVEAENGVRPKTLQIPVGNLVFEPRIAEGADLGELGRDIKVVPERTIALSLRATRKGLIEKITDRL